jgi:hypothetical protein
MEKKNTTKMERAAADVKEEMPDPAICQCKDVQRRYDGDGIAERDGATVWYVCSACGKKYK